MEANAITDNVNYIEWTFRFRQILVAGGSFTSYFMFGLSMGAPTVIIPQIRRESNATDAINIHMESWISSGLGFSAIPWVFILSILTYSIGRKQTFLLVSVMTLIGYAIFYWGFTVTFVLISEVFHGPLAASIVSLQFLIAAEYTIPKYRGTVSTVNTATMFWGIWLSNAIGTFFRWENIGIFGLVCSVYSILIIFIWPESPYWLAMRGRFEECAASHRWLKGTSKESERELESLLGFHSEIKPSTQKSTSIVDHARNFLKVIVLPEVYKPLSLCFLGISMFHFTGKVVSTMYSIQIIKKITNSESAAYMGMLILDGVTVFGMYCGCILMKRFSRRTYLLNSCFMSIILLLVITSYLYLIKLCVITENKFVSIGLLSILFFVISVGPMLLTPILNSELIPLKSRNICVGISSFYAKALMALMLKITPYIFRLIDFHGTFLLFAIVCSICLYLQYKYLPETQNKSLIEISEIFKKSSKLHNDSKELMPLKASQNQGENDA